MGFLHAGQPADASLTFADTILTEDDIRDEKDCARNVVLIAREANILVHAFDLSVSDISTINVGKQIEHSHHANEPEVDLHTENRKASQQWAIFLLPTTGSRTTFRTTLFPSFPSNRCASSTSSGDNPAYWSAAATLSWCSYFNLSSMVACLLGK
jgi:hypothetical protein